MSRRPFTLLLAALTLAGAVRLAAWPNGPLPPLGRVLDPVRGLWTAHEAPRASPERLRIPGLTAPVEIVYDDRDVPHLFATNELDLWRAMGWVVARDRLFQLELQTRSAAGTLSELVGPRALDYDRHQRALGLAWAAERQWASMAPGTDARRTLEAYAEGVNAWIASLGPGEYPAEYRLLDARPMPWKPAYSLYFAASMSQTLGYQEFELARAAAAARVGEAAARSVFPTHAPIQQPIVPNGGLPAELHVRVAGPGTGSGEAPRLSPPSFPTRAGREGDRWQSYASRPGGDEPHEPFGSNNWAVAPSRSASGHALLAGDPHLQLSLPSIWYEVHLVVPDSIDVHGAAFAGLPAVLFGITRDVAWAETNTGSDGADFYAETVDNPADPRAYRLDGAMQPLTLRVETYRGPGGAVLAVDTIRHTHRGPMRREGGRWLSLRWFGHETDGTRDWIHGWQAAIRATTAEGVLDSIARFRGPPQNVLVGDRRGTIAIRSTGAFPIRPPGVTGDEILDGSTRATDWLGYRTAEQFPQAVNPARGWLASANQEPVDPRRDSTYWGLDWPSPWRAERLAEALDTARGMTADGMRALQTDPGNMLAERFVPRLLAIAARARGAGRLDAAADSAALLLEYWDTRYLPSSEAATLHEHVLVQLRQRTWEELGDSGRRVATPEDQVLWALLADSTNGWWDDRRTAAREDRDAIVLAALGGGWRSAVAAYGPRRGDAWRWGATHPLDLKHLLRLPAFSRTRPARMAPGTLSPWTRSGHGASWRMVIELGDTIRSFGIYPGGQSGNPASPSYADRIAHWAEGRLDTLRVPRTPKELPERQRKSTVTLVPGSAL